MNLSGKSIFITGGTGSFGQAYTRYLLDHHQPAQIVLFSRDEQKHFEIEHEFASHLDHIKLVIGDVRNRHSLIRATKGIDVLIHAASMKHVPMVQANPYEAVQTNLIGSQNVIDACQANGIERVVALSTDKAVEPSNSYGASKLLLEQLFLTADKHAEAGQTRFTLVRYANIFGSSGSVVPLFLKQRENGVLTLTDPEMTRFSITKQESIDLVQYALSEGTGGEIVIPIAPSYRLQDLANAIAPDCSQNVLGIRAGEKMHEMMYSKQEYPRVVKQGRYYLVLPQASDKKASDIPTEYRSDENSYFLSVEEITRAIQA